MDRNPGSDYQPLIRDIAPRIGDSFEVGTITTFVGPPNAGKTATLLDLLRLAANFEPQESESEDVEPTVLRDLTLHGKLSLERLSLGLSELPNGGGADPRVQGFGPDIRSAHQVVLGQEIKSILLRPMITSQAVRSTALSAAMPLRAIYLDTERRTDLVMPSPSARPDRVPENLLQALQDAAPEVHQQLDDAFASIFPGYHLRLDDSARIELRLRVSATFPDEDTDPVAKLRQLEQIPSLDQAGGGWRSLVGILLAVLLAPGRIVVIDQPELNLHPETAGGLGRWLANNIQPLGSQLFLTTNSADLLAGLLEGAADTSVVRLVRSEEGTALTPVPADVCRTVASDPLLSSQGGLDCLFRERVVVVPHPVDAVLYESVAHSIPQSAGVRFFHAHGSRHLPAVSRLLRSAQCDLRIVSGMDLFRTSEQFCGLVEAASGTTPPRPWLATRERLAQQVENVFDEDSISADSRDVEAFLAQLEEGADPSVELESTSASDRAWQNVELGDASWLSLELRSWVEDLIQDLRQRRIFVAPRDNVASWLPELASNAGSDWLRQAVETLRAGHGPGELQAFVSELLH